jgi:CDP-4-dehydro-6-deoxyglucose reductase, E1
MINSIPAVKNLNWPLMRNNIIREDLDAVIDYLRQDEPMLTQSVQVSTFEREWSEWLGVKYSVFVNSGSSANLITLAALRERHGTGEVIVPTLTWVSDIASVLQCGFAPVFVDINPRTLGMDNAEVIRKLNSKTRAVFITHTLGYNALSQELLDELKVRNIPLIEDVCESHGATFQERKLGTFSLMSNFSFYYAHHMSTIEGGMVCTDDEDLYQTLRMFRSHGMVREMTSQERKSALYDKYDDLNPDFIFMFPSYNVRSTELNAILGRSQLKRLDTQNVQRRKNLDIFLKHLSPERYFVDFDVAGNSNYAFTLVLNKPDVALRDAVMQTLRTAGVEFRRGTSGGGNQLRQPYLRQYITPETLKQYPRVDHVHFFGFYIGNYPSLEESKIIELCSMLNNIRV